MWKSPILASSATTAKSQEIMSSNPPATACPSTTATVGFWRLKARSKVRAETWAISTELFVVPRNSESSMLRSAPAQKVCPRPRMSTTRTSGSRSARSSAAPSCISNPQLTQFLTSGRLNQIVATWSETSYWMYSGSVSTGWVAACRAVMNTSAFLIVVPKLNSDYTHVRLFGKFLSSEAPSSARTLTQQGVAANRRRCGSNARRDRLAILNWIRFMMYGHDDDRSHPHPAPAHRIGERVAAARRPADAPRHGAVQRRRPRRARARAQGLRRGDGRHRTRDRYPSPSRPRGAGGDRPS